MGLQVVQELWTHDINSELAVDATSFEQLMAHYREGSYTWVVLVKADSKERGLKVKSLVKKEEFDIRYSDLATWLRTEIRTRSHRDIWPENPKLFRNTSQTDTGGSSSERVNDVRILVAQHRNKKTNRRNIIDSGKFLSKTLQKYRQYLTFFIFYFFFLALLRTRELVEKAVNGPIVAIDTRDDILDAVRDTRLCDPDSWRTVIQNAPLTERKYLGQVHELLHDLANEYRLPREGKESYNNAFIYNFRTGSCVYYDLGRST